MSDQRESCRVGSGHQIGECGGSDWLLPGVLALYFLVLILAFLFLAMQLHAGDELSPVNNPR